MQGGWLLVAKSLTFNRFTLSPDDTPSQGEYL